MLFSDKLFNDTLSKLLPRAHRDLEEIVATFFPRPDLCASACVESVETACDVPKAAKQPPLARWYDQDSQRDA